MVPAISTTSSGSSGVPPRLRSSTNILFASITVIIFFRITHIPLRNRSFQDILERDWRMRAESKCLSEFSAVNRHSNHQYRRNRFSSTSFPLDCFCCTFPTFAVVFVTCLLGTEVDADLRFFVGLGSYTSSSLSTTR